MTSRRRDIIRSERASMPRSGIVSPTRRPGRRSAAPPTRPRAPRAGTIRGWKATLRGASAAAAVGLMVLPSMLPAYATLSSPASESSAAIGSTAQVQSMNATPAGTPAAPLTRDGYSVTVKPQVPKMSFASSNPYSSRADTFVNDPNSPIQWPFTQGVPISSGFGYRTPPCSVCSSNHKGIDMNPGAGTPIQAIADGVVADVGNPSGAYGVYAVIDHLVDGEQVSSMYAHMQLGSMSLTPGDTVSVGQVIGAVGSTGASTGAHLHFEIRLGGTLPIDPYAWLKAKVGS